MVNTNLVNLLKEVETLQDAFRTLQEKEFSLSIRVYDPSKEYKILSAREGYLITEQRGIDKIQEIHPIGTNIFYRVSEKGL